ncbi:MAG: hybrid sensor histidine kinase/response regulator [Sphingomonas sp.]|nr:hybrid sensor histidine kinase/response regulator [Sphingomonas sp.]
MMTEQSRFDAHLAERRFQTLINSVTEYAIYMLDTGGYVRNWNAGAEAIKGYSEQEIVGQHFSRFYTPEDRDRGVPAIALATALSEGKYESEAWRLRKDGTRFWAHVVLDPIFDEQGNHVGFAKITRDITEKRLAQEQLDQTREALFQAQKLQALGELTGGIAHDFNNLITVIRGSAELLQNPRLDPAKAKRYVDSIVAASDRAAELTSHLLAFGRRQSLSPETVDLNIRLDAFVEMLSRTLGDTIEVRLRSEGGLWTVRVDDTQLETALLNAAINARDAMPDGGTITIESTNIPASDGEPDLVCIALSDTGPGIPDDVLKRVFEPFFTTKPVGKGTGLGLSQIHGFAAQSGGRAEIESKQGEGTTVRLLLPRATGEARHVERPVSSVPHGRNLTVLVVDDNEAVLQFAVDLLESLGYMARTAESGDDALDILRSAHVDIVFSDVLMPGITGIELARRVEQDWPGLPLVLTSGYSEELVRDLDLRWELVPKPYTAESLSGAFERALSDTSSEVSRTDPG